MPPLNPQEAAQAAATQLDQNRPTSVSDALQTVNSFLSQSLQANANNPGAQMQAFQQMTQALEQRGILPRIIAGSMGNEAFFRTIDLNNDQRIVTTEAQEFLQNPERVRTANAVQVMSLMALLRDGTVTGVLGRPNGSVTLENLQSWMRRANEPNGATTPEVAAANNTLTRPPAGYEASPQHMDTIRRAQETLRTSGALHAIENGKPGPMPELIAEYARTHYSELADTTSHRITLTSINRYLERNPNLTAFSRDMVTQLRDRFYDISQCGADQRGYSFNPFGSNGAITLQGLEAWRAKIQPAREAAEFLNTPEGRTLFGDNSNPPRFFGAANARPPERAAQVIAQYQAILNNQNSTGAEKENAERIIRIGRFIETQVSHNWSAHYATYNEIVSAANSAGYRANDVSTTQTPPRPAPVGNGAIAQPAPIGNGSIIQPAPIGNGSIVQPAPIGNANFGQPAPIGNANLGQQPPAIPNPFEQIPQRPAWNRAGTPERQLMDQTIALLRSPGSFAAGSENLRNLNTLFNNNPETMVRVLDEINRELELAHSNHRLSYVTNFNSDGTQCKMLSVMREGSPGSWTNEGTAMVGQLQNRAPELTTWQRQVRELQGPNAFVITPGGSVADSNTTFEAACARAQQQGVRLTVVYGSESNSQLLAAARTAAQNGQVVLYANVREIAAGSELDRYFRGASTPNQEFPYGWLTGNGGAISVEPVAHSGNRTYYQSDLGRPAAASPPRSAEAAPSVAPEVYGPLGPNAMIWTDQGQMTRQQYHRAMTQAGWQIVGYDQSSYPVYQQNAQQNQFGYSGNGQPYYGRPASYGQPNGRRGLLRIR